MLRGLVGGWCRSDARVLTANMLFAWLSHILVCCTSVNMSVVCRNQRYWEYSDVEEQLQAKNTIWGEQSRKEPDWEKTRKQGDEYKSICARVSLGVAGVLRHVAVELCPIVLCCRKWKGSVLLAILTAKGWWGTRIHIDSQISDKVDYNWCLKVGKSFSM